MKNRVLVIVTLATIAVLLAACGGGGPAPTEMSAVATEVSGPTVTPLPTEVPTVVPTATAVPAKASGAVGASSVLTGRGNERIVFPVFDPKRETYDIYVAALDGSGCHRLVAEASQPALSPDGQSIAYVSWKNGVRGVWGQTRGGPPYVLNPHFEARHPSWPPGEQAIVFASSEGSPQRIPGIYVTDPSSGQGYSSLRGEQDPGTFGGFRGDWPAWLPDNVSVTFALASCGACGIVVVNVTESTPRPVRVTTDTSDIAPAPSPDGKHIAFMSGRDGNWEIYVVGTDGSKLTRLTVNEANDGLPTWSPDGKMLAFVSDRDGKWAIWGMEPDGSGQMKFFDIGGSIDGKVGLDVENSLGWTHEQIDWTASLDMPIPGE
jgi:Tol biopolymer transport system component